jgi:hypothetical protein
LVWLMKRPQLQGMAPPKPEEMQHGE